MKTLKFKTFKKVTLLFTTLLIISCGVQMPTQVSPISKQDAINIMNAEVGAATPERKLYHTYEENYSYHSYDTQNRKNTLSFSKIEGNYVEGVLISVIEGGSNVSFPVFGRYDFNHLYIYTQGSPTFNVQTDFPWGSNVEAQEIFVFEIGQNGRRLTRKKFAYRVENNILKWEKEPPYNVDLDSRKKYKLIFSSTGFISKTDDYIGEDSKTNSNVGNQTLTQKLKELKKLYDDELITEEEYNKARKALLEK